MLPSPVTAQLSVFVDPDPEPDPELELELGTASTAFDANNAHASDEMKRCDLWKCMWLRTTASRMPGYTAPGVGKFAPCTHSSSMNIGLFKDGHLVARCAQHKNRQRKSAARAHDVAIAACARESISEGVVARLVSDWKRSALNDTCRRDRVARASTWERRQKEICSVKKVD